MTYQEKMDAADVELCIPNIVGHYRRTSDPTLDYNCLAWAVGNTEKWFAPEKRTAGYYWPPGIDREWNATTIRQVLAYYGYHEEASNSDYEVGFLKVAVYVDEGGNPSHFSRQLPNGKWTSKLGDLIDIEHDNLSCLEGDPGYGTFSYIVKKIA